MSDNTEHSCATCGKSASLQCGRCKNAWYCNRDCQRSDWKTHRKDCSEGDLDRIVTRAGTLLQDVFLIFAERTYASNVVNVEDKGDELVIIDGPRQPGQYFYAFPKNLVHDESDKKMILCAEMCTEAIGYFHDFLKELLTNKCSCTRRQQCQARAPLTLTKETRVKTWVIDPTGPQFSIFTPVTDRDAYWNKYVEQPIEDYDWGENKRTVSEYPQARGYNGLMGRVSWAAIREVDQALSAWKSKHETTLPKLLREPEGKFVSLRASLLSTIDDGLRAFVARSDYRQDVFAAKREGTLMRLESIRRARTTGPAANGSQDDNPTGATDDMLTRVLQSMDPINIHFL
ncbi:uncharacterized protein EI97DRAFT_474255 [Westerdykella ornata]|uniref:MYND-type domain-containing protein n=1 Tax=Westerdykella ornata TaxID=318751 RepID=A0A6A6JJX3_WESOR|nr:uncharacterized protein EI97DRAFT_474255 [Westerdykella ornata]KAF2276278.1 hypothetical protein EI97DRAFT_474255 [Westerdykella ornata]